MVKASLGLFLFAWCAAGILPLQGADWKIAAIDSTGTGYFSSLRIDKNGNAHVAYIVEDLGHLLKYAFWDHSQDKCFTMAVDGNASFCSLALHSHQRPHISYADFGTDHGARLKYAHWDGTAWIKETIPLDSDVVGFYTSIALDQNDHPGISFYEYRGPIGSDFVLRLRAVIWNGKYWEVRTVDGSTGSGKINSIAVDSQGRFLLGYANVNGMTAGARFAIWDGSVWKAEVIDDMASNQGHTVGYDLAMALDKKGNPHLSYWDANVPLVKYATLANGHWVTEVVDSPGPGSANRHAPVNTDRNSMAVDEEGHPYIGYYDARHGQLRLAHKQGAGWEIEIVDGGSAGLTSSLQIDRGVIWITYADEGGQQLKVARRTLETSPIVNGEDKSGEASQAAKPGQLQRAK